jgi:hypothetical protein
MSSGNADPGSVEKPSGPRRTAGNRNSRVMTLGPKS